MSSVIHSLGESYIITYQALLMLGSTSTAKTSSQNIAFLSIFFGGMILYWLWEAMLISYFAFPSKSLPFYDMEGFLSESEQKVSLKTVFLVLIVFN